MPTKCKQPKQAIHADRNQEIQRPQTNANKTFSRQRFCVWRQTCFIMAPKTGSKKLVETWRPERDLDCTRNKLDQIGTHREKKRVLTLTLMLVRRKSASKTSAGSCKILRWLTPLLVPNLDPKTGPKQSPKRRNVNVIQFRTPILGSIFGPKNGVRHRTILQLPVNVLQADLRRASMSVSVNTRFFSLCVPICFLYSRGPFLAAMFLLVFWALF